MSIFERFRDHSILVVGDVMLDKYVHGQVRRISPEAPIQILNVGARRSVLGGAGNVAKNVNDLGCHVTLVGVVGADEMADEFMETAGNICIDLIIDPTRPTTTKTRFVADNHQLLRVDDEVTKPISPEVEQMLIEAVHDSLSDVDVVVLSDYAKGVLTDTVLAAIMEMAKGKTIIVDPKRPSFTVYRGATIITPNEWELRAGTGITDLDEAAEKAMAASDAEAIVVTRSEKGVSLFRSNEPPVHIPAVTRDVADVSGAGDTLVAVLAACLAAQMDLPDALTIANRAAGVAVSKCGTASVTVAELRASMNELRSKIVSHSGAADLVAVWRQQGCKVGFTNGCFDLLHPGHINLLRKAREKCDRLVIGLNTDASVRRLKGLCRPVQTETARATVLSELAAVDLVVMFDEDTPLNLIELLTPDVLMKGGDYAVDQIIGGDWVIGHGGIVETIDIVSGHSTSGLIERMSQNG